MKIISITALGQGSVVSVSASHAVGHGFVFLLGHTKHHYENGTNCLLAWHSDFRVGVLHCNPTVLEARNCLCGHAR